MFRNTDQPENEHFKSTLIRFLKRNPFFLNDIIENALLLVVWLYFLAQELGTVGCVRGAAACLGVGKHLYATPRLAPPANNATLPGPLTAPRGVRCGDTGLVNGP